MTSQRGSVDDGRAPSSAAGALKSLTIGELFPADDLLARWVFSLSAVTEDLALAERPFVEMLERPADPFTVLYTGFHYRQLVARVYEAERPISAIETHPEVRTFLEGVPEAGKPLAALRLFYLPWSEGEPSPVRRLFGGTRHMAVHHSWPGSAELRDALAAARDLEARLLVDDAENRLSYAWTEQVALRAMVADTASADGTPDMRGKVVVVREVLTNFAALLAAVLPAHCARLGIERSRLIDPGSS